jgi:hypothetical protein
MFFLCKDKSSMSNSPPRELLNRNREEEPMKKEQNMRGTRKGTQEIDEASSSLARDKS